MQTDPFTATPQPVHLPGVPDASITSYVKFMDGGDLVDIPVISINWMDERQGCRTVHEFLAGERQGTPDDWQGCPSLKHGYCSMNGKAKASPCLFQEPDDSIGWKKAMQWAYKLTEDGRRILALKASSAPQDGAS